MKKNKINSSYRIKIKRIDFELIRIMEGNIPFTDKFIFSHKQKGFDLFDFDKTGLYYSVDRKYDKSKNHKKILQAFKKYIIKCKRHRLGK